MKYRSIITNIDPVIMFILAGFSFCIFFGLSAPALLMNDEWITVNQVNQLASGSQLIENEGKYGSTLFHEKSNYFTTRNNNLGYSLFLPLLSMPSMKMIVWSGELFRLLFLIIWCGITISALLACIWLTGKCNKKVACGIAWGLLFLFFGIFLTNLYFYHPFLASIQNSPIESAAVIFSNEVLCALIAPLIYSIFRNISLDRRTALVGSLSVICCSTYFFWSTTAKDHLLVAFLLTVLFWVFSSTLVRESNLKWLSLFAISGLICWERPEYGSIILVGLIIWKTVSIFIIQNTSLRIKTFDKISTFISCVIGCIIGLSPFFLNNYLITTNPLIPPQYLYVISSRPNEANVLSSFDIVQSTIFVKVQLFVTQAIHFFYPKIENIFIDLAGLAFCPSNQGVGILFISPIFLPALLYGFIYYREYSTKYSSNIRHMIQFSTLIIVLTIIAYLRVIHGSTTSYGILPDMRYFSPLYLPMGIISILLLSPLIRLNPSRWLNYLLISVFVCAPLLVMGIIMTLPYGYSFYMHGYLFMRLLIILFILIFGYAAITKKFWTSEKIFPVLFSLLVMIPAAFQFLFVFVMNSDRINGYPFWLPALEYLFTNIIIIIN